MTDSIFTGETTPEPTPPQTQDGELLIALVGEKQKYKSAEELAKAYVNADGFITQLKEENKKLREENAKAATLDEVLERINKPTTKQDDTPAPPQLKAEDLEALVEKTLTGRESAKTREANLLQADKLMKEKYGEKAADVFKAKASSPQLQKVFMELASTSPQDFVALFATEAVVPSSAPSTSTVDTASFAASTSNRANMEGTKEWVSKIRKENPTTYWSQDFQVKLQKIVLSIPSLYFG
jgi:hypothetical protein